MTGKGEGPSDPKDQEDPLFRHARRELRMTLLAWLAFGIWVVGVSWWLGAGTDSEEVATVAGMPVWVFWGVGLPWLLANVFTFWYCFRYMADDDLESVPLESVPPEAATVKERSAKDEGGTRG